MKFVIFCPSAYTGGPFALLQLNEALNKIGHTSEVAIYDKISKKKLENGSVKIEYREVPETSIDSFKFNLCHRIDKDDVLIFPEVKLNLLKNYHQFGFANCVLWWLSWDNAPLLSLKKFEEMAALRQSISIFQSHYAQQQAQGLSITGPIVSDYTIFDKNRQSEQHPKTNDICFLPLKSVGTQKIITELRKSFSIIPIKEMSQSQVQDTLRSSKYFIDFGHHPGKDRIPREAALYDCVPIVRRAGAANHIEDVYLPNYLLLDDSEFVSIGNLTTKIKAVDKKRDVALSSIKPYKRRILAEYDLFLSQVTDFCDLFFSSPDTGAR